MPENCNAVLVLPKPVNVSFTDYTIIMLLIVQFEIRHQFYFDIYANILF